MNPRPRHPRLIGFAALLLFIAVPAVGIDLATAAAPAAAAPTHTTTHPVTSPHVGTATTATKPSSSKPGNVAAPASAVTHTVKRRETLWSIAEHHLGSGMRYPEIVKLNLKLLQGRARFLRPGWVLTLPPGAQAVAEQPGAVAHDHRNASYTVIKGDVLSEIAQQHLAVLTGDVG